MRREANRKLRLPSRQQAYDVFKIVAPPLIAVTILTILVLIPRVSNAIGTYAFLVLTYLHLFFYPYGTIGDHLEKVITHLFMCALGLGVTFLFVSITIWIDGPENAGLVYSSNGSKALGASVLGIWCLVGGICQSRYPRIKMAIRILLFSSTWTICLGATSITSSIFTNQFYPAAIAAGTSLVVNLLVFPRSAQDGFASLIVQYYSIERSFLEQVLIEFFSEDGISTARKPSQKLADLQQQIGVIAIKVEDKFRSARLEINFGHFAVVEAKPLVTSIARRKGWMSCGMGLGTREGLELAEEKNMMLQTELASKTSSGSNAETYKDLKDLEPAIAKLMSVMDESIRILSASIDLTMRKGKALTLRLDADGDDRGQALFAITRQQGVEKPSLIVLRQRQRMTNAIESFKEDLALILQRLALSSSTVGEETSNGENEKRSVSSVDGQRLDHGMFRSDIYDTAFLMVSLMEIASEIESSLTACQTVIAQWHAHPKRRLWLPMVSFSSWIKSKLSRETHTGFVFHEEERQGEHEDFFTSFSTSKESKEQHSTWEKLWTWTHRPNIIRWRVALSRGIKKLKNSSDLRYGLKLAGGAVLLSLPAWISSSRSWFVNQRGVWLVVTYIWVLETSTGATIRVSIYRAIGTMAGAVWAIVAWFICSQGNRYGIAFFIILAQVPAVYFILFTKHAQSLGLVFAFTQSVILFFPFTTLGASFTTSNVVQLGLVRWYQILLGIVAAFVVNVAIWPLHARVYLIRAISRITRQCSTIYLSLARQMLNHGIIIGPDTTRKFVKLEKNIQKELMASRDYLEIMHVELSLVPKPVHTLSLVIKTLQRIVDLLDLLRKCREVALRIIQKEACFNVLNLRKELVSNILLTFWIIGQSLVTKERLPQFLPSCRDALVELTQAMREEIRSAPLHVDLNHANHSRTQTQADQEVKETHSENLAIPSRLLPRKRTKHSQPGTPTSTSRPEKKVIDYSYFFVFAEHTLLSEIIFEIDKLLFLAKLLVGESSFIGSNYLPKGSQDVQRGNTYGFDPSILGSQDAHAFHNSMSEHGIDGRRLAAQLDAHLRASK